MVAKERGQLTVITVFAFCVATMHPLLSKAAALGTMCSTGREWRKTG
tara:strand:+ start:51 stop:191 length:141 start_codon:yes stop_codon:yes gene_type:complete